jgi:hypothetical protein
MLHEIDAALGLSLLDIEISVKIVVSGVFRQFSEVPEFIGDLAVTRKRARRR